MTGKPVQCLPSVRHSTGRLTAALLTAALVACASADPIPSIPGSSRSADGPSVDSTHSPNQGDPATGELVLVGATILTMDPELPESDAILINGDTIAAVGNGADVIATAGPDAEVIDLDGRVVLPGFIDSHSHRITQRGKWGLETERQATELALSEGWTGIHELAVSEGEFMALVEADARGDLRTRISAFLAVNGFDGSDVGTWWTAYEPGQVISPFLRVAGLKIFIDFDSGRTLLWSQEDLNEFVGQRHEEGWQVAMKAIGRQSHELALTALEFALDGASNEPHRHRLEHSLGVNDDQLERLADLGIVVGIQPGMPGVVWYEEDIRDLTAEEGPGAMFRWPEYLAAGVIAAASPYNPDPRYPELVEASHVSPMGVLYRGATQIGLGGSAPEPWMLDRALSVDQMLPMLTSIGAYSTHEEDVRGSLAVGKLADLVVLSPDPRALEPDELLGIEVLLTMVGGEVAYVVPALADHFEERAAESPAASTAPLPGGVVNVALDARVTASSELAGQPATKATDGTGAHWNASALAPQQIDLELAAPAEVARVVLTVAQDPAGPSVHELWLRRSGADLERVAVFEGVTGDGDVLTWDPAEPVPDVDMVRVVTTNLGDLFPAWREIEILAATSS